MHELNVVSAQWQLEPLASFQAFEDQARRLLDGAPEADVVLFPEYVTIGLLATLPTWPAVRRADFGLVAAHTESYVNFFRAEAERRGQAILAGSHLVSSGGVRNAAHLFLADGTVHVHSKTHRFPAEEEWGVEEGDDLVVPVVKGVPVGILTCYEVEVPEVASALARMGAEVLLCPAYTFTEAGAWRVRHCCQARCVENQVFVAVSYLVGTPPPPLFPGFGSSAVFTPCDEGFPVDGVAAAADGSGNQLVRATLALDLLDQNRRRGVAPTLRDRARHADFYRAIGSERHLAEPEPVGWTL